jgi:hypothetical protein
MDSQQRTQTSKVCTMCKRDTPIERYSWSNKKLGYRLSECQLCENDRKTEWRELRRKDNRMRVLHMLGGEYKCSRCSFTHTSPSPFDWHHLDVTKKEDSPMRMIHSNWKKLKQELDKCEFLCSNCHRIEHHG